MELRHLEYFVAVAEELNFTAAAGRLYVVQSAVSAGLKALERELEVTLFERTSRRVDLSEAGAAFLPHAYATLDAARGARDALAQVQGGLRGIVRVGTMTSVGIFDVPELLGDFHRQYPGVLLQLSAAPSGSLGLVEAVAERRLDLAFVSIPGENPPRITLTDLGHEPMDLVLPADHPLAEATTVAVTDLADYRLHRLTRRLRQPCRLRPGVRLDRDRPPRLHRSHRHRHSPRLRPQWAGHRTPTALRAPRHPRLSRGTGHRRGPRLADVPGNSKGSYTQRRCHSTGKAHPRPGHINLPRRKRSRSKRPQARPVGCGSVTRSSLWHCFSAVCGGCGE